MKREDAVLSWDPCGFDWIKDRVEDMEDKDENGKVAVPCSHCGQGTILKDADDIAYEEWCDYGAMDEWDYMTLELEQLLEGLNPDGSFYVGGHNMGWEHREGYKEVHLYGEDRPGPHSNRGAAFLAATMPKTEINLWVWAFDKDGEEFNPWATEDGFNLIGKLVLSVSHHDSMGELYEVVPLKEEEEEDE